MALWSHHILCEQKHRLLHNLKNKNYHRCLNNDVKVIAWQRFFRLEKPMFLLSRSCNHVCGCEKWCVFGVKAAFKDKDTTLYTKARKSCKTVESVFIVFFYITIYRHTQGFTSDPFSFSISMIVSKDFTESLCLISPILKPSPVVSQNK